MAEFAVSLFIPLGTALAWKLSHAFFRGKYKQTDTDTDTGPETGLDKTTASPPTPSPKVSTQKPALPLPRPKEQTNLSKPKNTPNPKENSSTVYVLNGMTWKQVLDKLENERAFALYFSQQILNDAGNNMEGFVWRTTPTSLKTCGIDLYAHEFVNAPFLVNRRLDAVTYKEYFDKAKRGGELAVAFKNTAPLSDGLTSMLVSPTPSIPENSNFNMLASFLRDKSITDDYKVAFWKKVAQTAVGLMTTDPLKPIWVNTHGGTVHWLHVRIEQTPKYYDENSTFRNYKRPTILL
jgi:hypothetical protein